MAFGLNDRVKETSTTTGTGTLNLAGAVEGFETFVAGIGTGKTTFYAIFAVTFKIVLLDNEVTLEEQDGSQGTDEFERTSPLMASASVAILLAVKGKSCQADCCNVSR